MKPILRWLGWATFAMVIRMRLYQLLSQIYASCIGEVSTDGAIQRSTGKGDGDKPTALVLSYEQFRGDIEDLAATGQVRILCLKEHWLTRLMFQFYPEGVGLAKHVPYFNPTQQDVTWAPKQQYRAFLKQFLPRLFDRLGVDILISHHVHCRQDFDWGAVSDELGYPYLVINRENLFVSEYIRNLAHRRISRLGQFEGRYVTVHNKVAEQVISGSGYVSKNHIHVLGCIRMDRFLKRLKTFGRPSQEKPAITFFTYLTRAGRGEDYGPKAQCSSVHRLLAEIAHENPAIEVIFKVKPTFYNTWKRMFDEATANFPVAVDQLDNLHISTTLPAHDLIERSNVIIGFNSTTVLEASIADRHVIVPYFGPWQEERYSEHVYLPDKMHLFNVPSDIEDMKRMIFKCLKSQKVDNTFLAERRSLFEEYVSPLDGSATAKHIQLIKTIYQEHRVVQQSVSTKRTLYDGVPGS